MPRRIQRQRTRGWRMPEGAVFVGRPSEWGNPWSATDPDAVWWAVAVGERGDAAGRRAGAVRWFDWWLRGDPARLPVTVADGPGDIEHADGTTGHLASAATGIALLMLAKDGPPPIPRRPELGPWLAPLRGRDLVCWCPLDAPCHADILLELANR